jgi:hypothetical protein
MLTSKSIVGDAVTLILTTWIAIIVLAVSLPPRSFSLAPGGK